VNRNSVLKEFKGVGHFECNFWWKGRRPPTAVGVRKLQTAVSCDIKRLAVGSFVLSPSTRVTHRQMDGQNFDGQYHASNASRGKNRQHEHQHTEKYNTLYHREMSLCNLLT